MLNRRSRGDDENAVVAAACHALVLHYGLRFGGIVIWVESSKVMEVAANYDLRLGEPPPPQIDLLKDSVTKRFADVVCKHYGVACGFITLSVHQGRIEKLSVNRVSRRRDRGPGDIEPMR